MPAVIELRLCPDSAVPPQFEPTTRQLHGLACTLFEGTGTDHGNQEKAWTVWPLRRDGARAAGRSGRRGAAPKSAIVRVVGGPMRIAMSVTLGAETLLLLAGNTLGPPLKFWSSPTPEIFPLPSAV